MGRTHVVVMGVAGCGKSTVGMALAEHLGWTFAEGDEFHPASNVATMRAGRPLTDDDRRPWLDAIVAWTAGEDALGRNTVVSCSALRRRYRDRLRAAPGRTVFVHLDLDRATLSRRMASRTGHFMPSSLLASQLDTLEALDPGENGIVLEAGGDVTGLVHAVATALGRPGASGGHGSE